MAHKIRDPYNQLVTYATQLENMQTTCELLRKLHRFILLKRRLEIQLAHNNNDRDISTAALTIYELETIMKESDFEGIDIVTCELTFIERSRDHVEEEAQALLKEGIETQNQTKMASGLQVFYNLKQMGDRVQDITQNMLNELIKEIKRVVDMQSLQKEMVSNVSSPNVRRVNHEPPIGNNQKQWAAAIWSRMESLMKNMSDHCIKVYSLEKVLELKKDALTHVSFLEEVSKVILNMCFRDYYSCIYRYWMQIVLLVIFGEYFLPVLKRS